MNYYDDSDITKLFILGALGIGIALALLLTIVPAVSQQKDMNNQLENRIKVLENTYQKS